MPASRGPWFYIATFFGAGLFPRAPGTMGSLASLLLWAPLVMYSAPWWVRAAVVVVVFALGVIASAHVVRTEGREDPQKIVIDEVAGMGIALLLAPPTWFSVVVGFALFRLFDIWKPWPVRWADRRIHGGLGVMLDDALAGFYALGCLLLVLHFAVPAFARSP